MNLQVRMTFTLADTLRQELSRKFQTPTPYDGPTVDITVNALIPLEVRDPEASAEIHNVIKEKSPDKDSAIFETPYEHVTTKDMQHLWHGLNSIQKLLDGKPLSNGTVPPFVEEGLQQSKKILLKIASEEATHLSESALHACEKNAVKMARKMYNVQGLKLEAAGEGTMENEFSNLSGIHFDLSKQHLQTIDACFQTIDIIDTLRRELKAHDKQFGGMDTTPPH
jgi:hypothetical protein